MPPDVATTVHQRSTWSLRSALYRPIGIAAVTVICTQFVLGGVYTFLFAAGAVSISTVSISTGVLGARPARWRVAVYCLAAGVCSLISLPVLPAAALARFPVQKVNYDLGEEIGWPSEVKLLAGVWSSLPSSERVRATLLAGNYGEAGAVDRYGASFGLPQAYSGANNFWLWGPPPATDTVAVAIGIDPALLHREFAQVRQVAIWNNGLGVADDEQDTPIYVATGLRESWASAWAAFRDFS